MNYLIVSILVLTLLNSSGYGQTNPLSSEGVFWVTSPETNILFQPRRFVFNGENKISQDTVILIDPAQTFQSIDGFGNCLTGGSATLLHRMDEGSRSAILKELFSTDGNNIGISYLRISIGASDLSDSVFSYDDIAVGETDPEMSRFSLDIEKADLIPVLKEILTINPDIKILGSPWSAPTWMKTNNNAKGGSLKPEYFDAYALYFVKYIEGMKKPRDQH